VIGRRLEVWIDKRAIWCDILLCLFNSSFVDVITQVRCMEVVWQLREIQRIYWSGEFDELAIFNSWWRELFVNQLICGTSLVVDNLEGRSIARFDQEHVHLKSRDSLERICSLSILFSTFLVSTCSSEACSSTVKSVWSRDAPIIGR